MRPIDKRLGTYWYTGITESGKTFKAYEDLKADVLASGWPALVVDNQRAKNFRTYLHARSIEEVIRCLWEEGTHAFYTPSDTDDFDSLMKAVVAGRRVHVLVDEARHVANPRYISPGFTAALRTWQHWEGTVRSCTQRIADIHQDAYAGLTEFYAFRVTSPRDLERCRQEWGLDPEQLRTLPQYAFLTYRAGF